MTVRAVRLSRAVPPPSTGHESHVSWKGLGRARKGRESLAGLGFLYPALLFWLHAEIGVEARRHTVFSSFTHFHNVHSTAREVLQEFRLVPQLEPPKVAEDAEIQPWPEDSQPKLGSGELCPYQRIPYSKMKKHVLMPYIFGENRLPECEQCDREFTHTCRFNMSSGGCSPNDRHSLLEYLLSRAEEGAPGYAEMLTMTPCDLLPLIWGRTLWLLGDSLMEDFTSALMCFFREFSNGTMHVFANDIMESEEPHARKLKYSYCFDLGGGTRICHLRRNKGPNFVRDLFPLLPQLGALPSDIMLLNFGMHSSNVTEYQEWLIEFRAAYKANRGQLPFLVWRESSPQHFRTPTGDFACPDCEQETDPYECVPVQGVRLNVENQLEVSDGGKEVVARGGWRNAAATPVMQQLGVPIMAIWNHSMPLWQYHFPRGMVAGGDCTHSCHPSVYEMWIYLLYKVLEGERPRLPVPQPSPL